MSSIEKKISFIVQDQFPQLFKEEGDKLVQFLTHYFKWAESNQRIAYANVASDVQVLSQNNIIVGSNTEFESLFNNGESIAIYRDNESYDIVTIDTVVSNTIIHLDANDEFTNVSTQIANTYDYYNTVYHARRTGEYRDIDDTTDTMLANFKDQYLQGIQFDLATNKRLLVKRSLDLYRSKGTERSVDLLFRLLYGTGASVYRPSRDIFTLSSGKWVIPKYLELVPLPFNVRLVGREVVGQTSGATAFVEEVIRRSINGVIRDIAYISSVRGSFQAGELIDSSDNLLLKDGLRTYLLGSLNRLIIDVNGSGSNLAIGDIVSIFSQNNYGSEAAGRVANTIGITGLSSFDFINGGYAYTNASEIIISEKVLEISNVTINVANTDAVSFYNIFDGFRQPKASLSFFDANNTVAAGDTVTRYYSNGTMAGQGKVLSTTFASNAGVMVASEIVGALHDPSIPNANLTGNVHYHANASVVLGQRIGTNATGNVFVSKRSSNIAGDGTTLDQAFVTRGVNVAGTVATTGNTLVTSAGINLQTFETNTHITIHHSGGAWETRLISNVINSSALTVFSAFTFTNAAANICYSVPNEYVGVYTNSTFHEIKRVGHIVNSTMLTVEGTFNRINVEAKIANVTPTGTLFITVGANQLGNVGFAFGTRTVTGNGTSFSGNYAVGDWVALHHNSTVYQINQINVITNTTSLILTHPMLYTNSASKMAKTVQNTAIVYGKILSFFANSTYGEPQLVNAVTNDHYLTVQGRFAFSNNATRFANTTVNTNIYFGANTVLATSNVYVSQTVTANVVGMRDLVRIQGSIDSIGLERGDTITQYDGSNTVGTATINAVSQSGNSIALDLVNIRGRFGPSMNLYSSDNTHTVNVTSVVCYVGVYNLNGAFIDTGNNFVTGNSSTNGSITSISSGSGASFNVVPDLIYTEYVDVNHDMLIDFLEVGLSDPDYGFSTGAQINSGSTIVDALEIVNTEFGKISGITDINPGSNYSIAPIALIYEPFSYVLHSYGQSDIYLSNVVGDYAIGEVVDQGTGRALVTQFRPIDTFPDTVPEHVTHYMKVERLRLLNEDYIIQTVNSSTRLIGSESGASANVDYIARDELSQFIGLNANISAEVTAANGAAVDIQITDSGFGFVNNETVTFQLGDIIGTAIADVSSHGTGAGYYRDRNGFLSSSKKLHDGWYYQQFSYDIQSSINRNKYEEIVDMITHVAGTKMFSTFISDTSDTITVNSYFSLTAE